MTEIPEHLLERSKARRAAIGGGAQAEAAGGEVAGAGGPAAAPEPAAPPAGRQATPAVPEPEPEPTLVRPEVLAARARRRIPFWVVPVLAFLPLWAYMFYGTLEPRPLPEGDPIAVGGEIFVPQCAHCHGGDGGGTVLAPALDQVVAHFPDFRDQMMWVRLGSTGWPGDTYGPGLPSLGGMPGFADLTDAELAKVVLYTRVTHGGLDPAEEEDLRLIAAGEMTFAEAGLGPQAVEAGVSEDEL